MFLNSLADKKLTGWNERVFTERDALDYCQRNKIYIVESVGEPYGRIAFYKGYTFILLNPLLESAARTWVLFHEIGHYILHAPQAARFSPLVRRKSDREANYIAAVAMMPKCVIEGKTFSEIQAEYGYPLELLQIRNQIVESEGI